MRGPAPVFRIGDLELDLNRRCLRSKGVEVRLRRKTFDVLVCLAESRGRLVSKEELFEHVWRGIAVSDDVLVGCIGEIRKALGDDARDPQWIQTVYGEGYRLLAEAGPGPVAAPPPNAKRWRIWVASAALVIAAAAWAALKITAGVDAPPKGEAGWWRFDERAGLMVGDSSGNGNAGLLSGGVRRAPGVLGGALEFDGQTGSLTGEHPGHSFPRGGAPRTVLCWLRTSQTPEEDTGLFHYGSLQQRPRENFHLFLSPAGAVGWGNGYGHGTVMSRRTVADGRWRHVAAVYSGPPSRYTEVFIDGVKDSGAVLPSFAETGDSSRWTAGLFMAGGVPFQGFLDDLRIFAGALWLGEIAAIYRCTSPESALTLPFSGRPYFLPLGNTEMIMEPRPPGASSAPLANYTSGLAAVQFAVSDGRCGYQSLRGAVMPHNLRLRLKIQAPGWGPGRATAAGAFFGSRPLTPRQRLDEPGNTGVWVGLSSEGTVSVRRVGVGWDRPEGILARASAFPRFDDRKPHDLTIELRGRRLRAWVDTTPVPEVVLAEDAEGAAGIAFHASGKPLFSLPLRATDLVID
jgi:hypothetical protein